MDGTWMVNSDDRLPPRRMVKVENHTNSAPPSRRCSGVVVFHPHELVRDRPVEVTHASPNRVGESRSRLYEIPATGTWLGFGGQRREASLATAPHVTRRAVTGSVPDNAEHLTPRRGDAP